VALAKGKSESLVYCKAGVIDIAKMIVALFSASKKELLPWAN
jgi:hypothetical protein